MTTTRICGGEDLLGEERGGGREGEHRRPPDVISDERRDYLLLYRAAFLRPWMIGRFRRLCDERLLGLLITKRRLLQAKHRVSMDRLGPSVASMDTDCRCWPYSFLQRHRPKQRRTMYAYEMRFHDCTPYRYDLYQLPAHGLGKQSERIVPCFFFPSLLFPLSRENEISSRLGRKKKALGPITFFVHGSRCQMRSHGFPKYGNVSKHLLAC